MRVVRRLLVVVLLAAVITAVVVNVVVAGRLERIDDAFAGLSARPPEAPGRTILMVGTRPGSEGGPDVPWLEGEQSVEAVMLVVIAEDGRSARVETLPARSRVADVATTARPADLVGSVETWSGQRVDHLAAIDWQTFDRLAEHNGVAASYSYGSSPRAQQDFLKVVMEGTLHAEMRTHPFDLYRAISTTVDGTAVDDGWNVLELDRLLFSLRGLRSHGITYAMAAPG